jgi:hypothetical protein
MTRLRLKTHLFRSGWVFEQAERAGNQPIGADAGCQGLPSGTRIVEANATSRMGSGPEFWNFDREVDGI